MSKRRSRLGRQKDEGFQAGPGALVAVSYELYDAEGELIEASDPGSELTFLFGYGQVAPALEVALAGMQAGMACRVRLSPEEAFGERDPEAVIEVDRAELPPDAAVGDELSAESDSGEPVTLRILELTPELAVLDANHALAGQSVEVDLLVESVRPATPQELEAAEAKLLSSGGKGAETLIPLGRLLKRGGPEAAGVPAADPGTSPDTTEKRIDGSA